MNKKIIGAVAVIAVAGIFIFKSGMGKRTPVKVAEVAVGRLADSSLYSGTVVPGELVPVYIEAPAVVERVLIKEGEEVSKGTDLLVFSNKSILENEKAIKMNALDLKDINLQVADLESGTLKLELDKRELEIKELEEAINADAKKLPTLEREAKVFAELLKKDGVSSIEAEKRQQAYDNLKVELGLNRDKYNLMVVGYESLKRELNIEEAKLRSQLEKLKLQEETLRKREEQLKAPLKSPIDGVVVKLDVIEGAMTSEGERLLAISTKGESRINVEVPLYQANTIAKGQEAKIISRELNGNKEYLGTVERISSAARDVRGGKDKVVDVEISINGENDLRPGFVTDVEIAGKVKTNVPVINSFSVQESDGRYYVYVVENGVAKKQEVKVGGRTTSSYEILDLPVGTKVVVNPFKIKNGDKVKVVE